MNNSYHSPQVYFRNQGLRYLILTCFSLTLASDGCFKILHFECKLVKMHTTRVSFPLHLSVQQSWRHQHLWLNLRIAAVAVLLYLCFSPQSTLDLAVSQTLCGIIGHWKLYTDLFVATVFVIAVFYISVYTNSCLVGWLKASVRSPLCL